MKKHCAAAVLSVCETRTIHGESAVAASAVGLQPKRFRAQEKVATCSKCMVLGELGPFW